MKYSIYDQILYEATKTPCINAILTRYAIEFLERCYPNSLVAECLAQSKPIPTNSPFLYYKSDNRFSTGQVE